MIALFLVLFVVHVVFSLVTLRQDLKQASKPLLVAHLVTQLPLFVLALYFAARAGVFSRQLISPVHICVGLIAGHLVFGVSLLITHRSLSDTWQHFFDLGSLWDFAMDSPFVLTRFLSVAIGEEMIYRVAAQDLLIGITGRPVVAVLIVAGCFILVHRHFFQNSWAVSAEFAAFAILLGVLYYLTNSFILVVVIHAVRDIEIAYLEYLIKVEELGDEKLAAKEMERDYRHRTERP